MVERSQQFRWMRPNAHLYVREDAHRFMAPGAPRRIGRDVAKYFEPVRRGERDLEMREQKYSPLQPRVPRGNPTGGRWTSSGRAASGQAAGDSAGGALGGDQIVLGEGSEFSWEVVASDLNVDGLLSRELAVNALDGTKILSEVTTNGDERYFVLSPDGNGATFLNSGNIQTILNGDGQRISETEWTDNGPEASATVEPVLWQGPAIAVGRAGVQKTIELGLSLYTWLSSRTNPDEVAVFAFRAQDIQFEADTTQPVLSSVQTLSQEEVEKVCGKLDQVQKLTDAAVDSARAEGLAGAALGSRVHAIIAGEINSKGDSTFKAEISLLKSLEVGAKLPKFEDIGRENYGRLGTARYDAFEYHPEKALACIYDPKTEDAVLRAPRMMELAKTAKLNFPHINRFVVIQIKPSR